MKRMFAATVILFAGVASYIMGFAVLGEPLGYMVDLFLSLDPSTGDTMNLLPWIFGATIVFGVFACFIIYAVYGHKKEFEQ